MNPYNPWSFGVKAYRILFIFIIATSLSVAIFYVYNGGRFGSEVGTYDMQKLPPAEKVPPAAKDTASHDRV